MHDFKWVYVYTTVIVLVMAWYALQPTYTSQHPNDMKWVPFQPQMELLIFHILQCPYHCFKTGKGEHDKMVASLHECSCQQVRPPNYVCCVLHTYLPSHAYLSTVHTVTELSDKILHILLLSHLNPASLISVSKHSASCLVLQPRAKTPNVTISGYRLDLWISLRTS